MQSNTFRIAHSIFFVASIVLSSCHSKKAVELKSNSQPAIRFYYRDVGCNNGDCTYADFIILENYRNNKYTVRQMADLAIRYLDTAKADLPITSVIIVGEKPGVSLPAGMTKTYHEHADYQVVTFHFEKTMPDTLQTTGITSIVLWKKGESQDLDTPVDSLLGSKDLLNNEN